MFVPETTANADHLAEVVGLAETSALVDAFGGGTVYLPSLEARPKGKAQAPTVAQVVRLTAKGLSAAIIARRYGCTKRAVYHKRARARERKEA